MAADEWKGFLKAVKSGDTAAIESLLTAAPQLATHADEEGATALHHAAWKGQAGAVSLLLARGADVKAQSRIGHYGGTPLHAAAHANHRAVVELLLEAGAEVNSVSCNGRTPLDETTIHNATAAARLLKERGGKNA